MKKIIVITGTPGTGKTTISEKISGSIENCEVIRANDLVKGLKLYTGRDSDGALIADMGRLGAEIQKRAKSSRAEVLIIEGHLLCDIKVRGATAIVLREHLKTLQKRLKTRGYTKMKIEDNIVSEATDYCGINAERNYKDVYEFMSGNSAVRNIYRLVEGARIKKLDIEMLDELNGLIG